MTNEKLKEKIIKIYNDSCSPAYIRGLKDRNGEELIPDIDVLADALIAAGFSFKDDFNARARLLLTAANHYEEEKDSEKQRADKAERALRKAVSFLSGMKLCTLGPDGSILAEKDIPEQEIYETFLSQAEDELAKEKKE